MLIRIDDHFKVRSLEPSDADELFALVDSNRSHLRDWLPWVDDHHSVDDSVAFIDGAQRQAASNNGMQAGLWYDGQLVGVIGHHGIDWPNKSASIGYWLAASFQGRGLMTKACKAMVSHAFQELGLHRVEIRCAPGNSKSRAIPERLGFSQEGRIRHGEWLYDHFEDSVVYGILEDESSGATGRWL